jgi:hypothetical protein
VRNSFYSLAFDQSVPEPDAEACIYSNWENSGVAMNEVYGQANILMDVLARIHLYWVHMQNSLLEQIHRSRFIHIVDTHINEVCPVIEALMWISYDPSAIN